MTLPEACGTFRWVLANPDAPLHKVKIYSAVVHCLKSFVREANFATLLKTVK